MCMSYEFLMQLFKWEFFSVKYGYQFCWSWVYIFITLTVFGWYLINIRLKNWNIKHFKSVTCIFSMKASYLSLDPKLRSFYLNVFIFKLLVSPWLSHYTLLNLKIVEDDTIHTNDKTYILRFVAMEFPLNYSIY